MVLLQVKWEGYEDPSDITWEPERLLRYVDHMNLTAFYSHNYLATLSGIFN
jgi:hypothetical protein